MKTTDQRYSAIGTDVHLTIGTAAEAAALTVKRIRYYESTGLLPEVKRNASGARTYGFSDIHTLRFIGRARALGFSLNDIRELLSLWQNPDRSNRDILELSETHLKDLLDRKAALDSIIENLRHLIHACNGDGRPECPIINELAEFEIVPPLKGK